MTPIDLDPSMMPGTVTVTVGAGGAGGAAQTTASTNGIAGSAGGTTTFGPYAGASGGTQGGAGTTAGGTGGSGADGIFTVGSGIAGSFTAIGSPSIPAFVPGGGGGGGVTAANVVTRPSMSASAVFAGSVGALNLSPTTSYGGTASTSGNATAGVSGSFGAGGSGGGAGTDGVGDSGAGGAGGAGMVIVSTLVAPHVRVQVFRSSGTWVKPTDARLSTARIIVRGAGGGGGSGRRGALPPHVAVAVAALPEAGSQRRSRSRRSLRRSP